MKPFLRAAALALVAGAAVPLGCAASGAELTLDGHRFRVRGADLSDATLTVSVAGSDVALFGELRAEKDSLSFEPRYPLRPGVEYRAVFRSASGGTVEKKFTIPAPAVASTTVVRAVFPSRDVLPENLLKFYLHFTAPMSRREVYRRVHLLDEKGKAVELPFLELGEELWNRETTRVTLLFDPGRIKRGLKPREDSGPALEEGKSYTLVVDAEWPDAEGRPLKGGFRKSFKVVAPDEKQPDPKLWTLHAPRAGSREPLVVEFNEPLDEAMLHRALIVHGEAHRGVEGTIEIDREETRWRFTPSAPWVSEKHTLAVNDELEDLAGNSIDRPFEVDETRPIKRNITVRFINLPFEPYLK